MKPAKPKLGTIACPICAQPAEVRQMTTRKKLAEGEKAPRQGGYVGSYYVFCADADGAARCGAVQANGAAAQAKLRARTDWLPGHAPAAGLNVPTRPAPVAAPVAAPVPASSSAPARKPFNPLDF